MKRILFFLLFFFLLCAVHAEATEYWVSPSLGGDAGTTCANASGTSPPASYLRTIQRGVNCAVNGGGDIVRVRGGTYAERVSITPANSGTVSNPTRILRYQAEVVEIVAHATCSALAPQNRPDPLCSGNMEIGTITGNPHATYIEVDGINLNGANLLGAQHDPVSVTGPVAVCLNIQGANHITFSNSIVKNCPTTSITNFARGNLGTLIGDTTHNTFRNVTVQDNWWDCIGCNGVAGRGYFSGNAFYITTANNVVENSTIFNIGGIGIRFFDSSGSTPSNNNTARFNRIYNFARAGAACGISIGDDNNSIHNNLVYDSVQESGCGIDVRDDRSPNATLLKNNTFYNVAGNDVTGQYRVLDIAASASNTLVENNILFAIKGGISVSNLGTNTTFSNNHCPASAGCTGTGTLNDNAVRFADPTNGDFRLCTGAKTPSSTCTAASVAIDAGLTLGFPYNVDIVGTSRPQGAAYDIGAYEAGGTTPPPSIALVAQYSFDNVATDSSGNGNHGTLTGGATYDPSGKYNQALILDGTNDYVLVADSNSLDLSTAFSIGLWAYPTAAPGDFRALVVKNYKYYLYASSTTCGAGFPLGGYSQGGSGAEACYGIALPLNTWTRVDVTYNAQSSPHVKLYIGGLEVTNAIGSATIDPSTGSLQIGASQYGEYFQGKIDSVRIYSGAIPATFGANDFSCADMTVSTASVRRDMNCSINPSGPTPPGALRMGSSGTFQMGATGTFQMGGTP